jgi:aminoglycoside phosphotransferase (APT) family kinase protein
MLSSTHLETLSQRVVILPFTPDGTRPLAVIKVSKLPSLNSTLDREQQTLAEVRRILGPGMRNTIPVPLGTQRCHDVIVAAESYRPGESLQRSSGRWGAPMARKLDDLRLAAEWLAEFHTQTTIERAPWSVSHVARWVDAPIEAYGRAFGVASDERRLFVRVRAYAESLEGLPLPIVWRKPDFFGSNVLREGREVSVVDWESPEQGPALCDLIRFVTPWSEMVRHVRADQIAGNFRRLFLEPPSDAISDAVHEAIRCYLERLDMDSRFLPLLLVYTWVDRALHHRDKQHLQGEHPRDTRAGNRHVGRVTLLARHVDQLFSGSSSVTPSPL